MCLPTRACADSVSTILSRGVFAERDLNIWTLSEGNRPICPPSTRVSFADNFLPETASGHRVYDANNSVSCIPVVLSRYIIMLVDIQPFKKKKSYCVAKNWILTARRNQQYYCFLRLLRLLSHNIIMAPCVRCDATVTLLDTSCGDFSGSHRAETSLPRS